MWIILRCRGSWHWVSMEGEDQPRLEERPDSVAGSRAGGRVVPAPKPLTREELLAASWVPTRPFLPLGRAAEGGRGEGQRLKRGWDRGRRQQSLPPAGRPTRAGLGGRCPRCRHRLVVSREARRGVGCTPALCIPGRKPGRRAEGLPRARPPRETQLPAHGPRGPGRAPAHTRGFILPCRFAVRFGFFLRHQSPELPRLFYAASVPSLNL